VCAPAEEADVIIVNTCGFIAPAKDESIQAVLELARHKESGRCRKLLVIGCLAQRYACELRALLPEADGVFGLGEEDAIVAACGLRATGTRDVGRLLLTLPHTAYLRISDGCDNRCAYCVIPAIRGPYRSRPAAEVLREARALVAAGVRELNVIGQDTTRYGADLPRGPRIHELLAELAAIPKLRWLRLLYTHPAHFTDELIEAYATIPVLCPYVDLPVQHLNDEVLRRMGRKVTQREILDLIARLRKRVPGVAIRTTCIVGFPGETQAQFEELLALVRQIGFDHLGAFAYSREEGTRAARMRGQIPERVKAERLRRLMLLQREVVRRKQRVLRGMEVEVVIDRRAHQQQVWVARSRTQAPDVDGVTYVRGAGLRPGQFIRVVITGARGYDILARPVR